MQSCGKTLYIFIVLKLLVRMGTHTNGPAYIKNGSKRVSLAEHIGADLPFLFKILSVETALSIQVMYLA